MTALALLPACQRPNAPSPPKPATPSSQPSASASAALVPVPKARELLQTAPLDIEQLVWALDGKSFAIVNQREILLYDAMTRQHTATLNAQELSPVSGGGFVGISRDTWRPTIWGNDGREIASLSEDAAPPTASDKVGPAFLVSANGQIAVLVKPAPKSVQATVWELEQRRVVQTLSLTSMGTLLSNSGRYLAGAGVPWKAPTFVVETRSGRYLPLPSAFTDQHPRPKALVDQDGFLFEHDGGNSSVTPNPPYVRAIRLPAGAITSNLRFLSADVLAVHTDRGSLLWNPASQKLIRRFDDERLEPTVDGEGRHFVTRHEPPGKAASAWTYVVRSTQGGKLSGEFSGRAPLAFRPTTDELTQVDDGGSLISVDVNTHEAHPVAPAGRLEKLVAVDLDARGQRLLVGSADAASVWTPEASRVVPVPRLIDVRWGTGSEFATLAEMPGGKCSLQLWSATSDRPRTTQTLACLQRGEWQFSPNPGSLRHEVELTPEVRQLAQQYGVDLGDSKVSVTEERAFEALDKPGRVLSVRARPKDLGYDAVGNPAPVRDHPPYTAQLAFLSNERVVKLLGDAELTLYDRGRMSSQLTCEDLYRRTPRGLGWGGSELLPWGFGFNRLADGDKLLFANEGRSIVAGFERASCKRYPAARPPSLATQLQPESGVLGQRGSWLATLSHEGALTLWDLEHDTQRDVELAPAISVRRLMASRDDRFVVVSDQSQIYFVRARDAAWLRLRWISEGARTHLLSDTSERHYAGAEQALAKVRLRVEQPDSAPLLLDLSAYEARFGVRLKDDQLLRRFFR